MSNPPKTKHLLWLSPLLLLTPALHPNHTLFWGTPALQFFPWRKAALTLLQQSQPPLWLPQVGMGAPLAANHQSALFYPPTWLLLALGALGGDQALLWGHALLAALHLIVAAWGMARLAHALGTREPGPTVAGLAYGLSGYLVARLGFFSINAATAWVPWVLMGVLRTIRKPHRRTAADLALVWGLQWLAGHAQTAWYTALLAGLWALFLLTQQHAARRRAAVLYLSAAAVGAMGLAAVQLFPTAEYLSQSWRAGGVPPEEALTYSFWPWHLLGFVAPGVFGSPAQGTFWGFGNYWEDAVYLGLLPLLLALATPLRAVRRRGWPYHRRLAAFWLGATVLGMALALGIHSPLFMALYRHVPTFTMFRGPTRWSLWAEVGLALLAGLGAHAWHRPQGRWLYWSRLAVAGAIAVTIGTGLAWWVTRAVRPTFVQAFALVGIWSVGTAWLNLQAPLPDSPRRQRTRWAWAVTLWVTADLLVAGWGLNPTLPIRALTAPRPEVDAVRQTVGAGRLFLPPQDEYRLKFKRFFRFDTFHPPQGWDALRPSLLPNLPLWEGIPSANNFDPLVPDRYARWLQAWEQAPPIAQERLLDRMGVTVVEHVDEAPPYTFTFVQRPTAEPEVRWVPYALPIPSAQAALQAVLQRANVGGPAWRCAVVVEAESENALLPALHFPTSTAAPCTATAPARVQTLRRTATEGAWLVRAAQPGLLFWAEVWYPGWRAWVDDQPVPLLRAAYLFRAVVVPAGTHRVVIRYQPWWWPALAWFSALNGLLLLALRRPNRHKEAP